MVKIRIWGLPKEVEQAKFAIEENFKINYSSPPYKDRGESEYVRQYVEAELHAEKFQTTQAGREHGV